MTIRYNGQPVSIVEADEQSHYVKIESGDLISLKQLDWDSDDEIMKAIRKVSKPRILKRYPRLSAHLICESLGYYSPRSAELCIERYKNGEGHFCEWHDHILGIRARNNGIRYNNIQEYAVGMFEVTKDVIRWAIQNRRNHRGYMADYRQAKTVIAHEMQGKGPIFASWF